MGLYQRTNGIWYARWSRRGKLVRRSLGTTSRREAEAKYRDLTGKPATRRATTINNTRQKRATIEWRSAPETFGEMTDRWTHHLQYRSHMKVGSIEAYMVQVRRWKTRWGNLKPTELEAELIAEWHEERVSAPGRHGESTAKATLKFEVRCLQLFLRWCQRKSYVQTLPDLPVVSGVSKKQPRALSAGQVESLFEARRRHPRPQVRALNPILMLGLHAGLRREEIRFLAWKDIDLNERLLRVTAKPPHFSPKSHEERIVPLNAELMSLLLDLREDFPDAEWVCLNCEFGQWSLGLTKWARELFNAAKIDREHGTMHRLRHSFGTNLLHAGVDIETVRDLMGHADITTTARYLSTTDPRRRAAVDALTSKEPA